MSVKHKEQFKDVILLNKKIFLPWAEKKRHRNRNYKKKLFKTCDCPWKTFSVDRRQGFQDIIGLAIQDMNQANTINIQNIKSMIADKAHEIKLKISNKLRDRLICV